MTEVSARQGLLDFFPSFSFFSSCMLRICFDYKIPPSNIKDTHKKKGFSNKTPASTESMYLDIWVVGTLNQLLIRSS